MFIIQLKVAGQLRKAKISATHEQTQCSCFKIERNLIVQCIPLCECDGNRFPTIYLLMSELLMLGIEYYLYH